MDRGRLFAATRLNSDPSCPLVHKPSSVATRILPEDSKKDVTWGSTIRALAAGRPPERSLVDDLRLGIVRRRDRKSTRLNSSHSQISYAVFCLKKKKKNKTT